MGQIASWIDGHFLLVMLFIGTIFTVFWLFGLRHRLDIKEYAIVPIAIVHTIAGVLTVKLFAVMETLDLSNVESMSLFGGVFFMPLIYFAGAKLFRRNTAEVTDIFTVCMVFTVMCARINCLHAGCCQGLLIAGLQGSRWPTRQAEILYYVVLLIIIIRKIKKEKTKGEIYPLYMMTYGAVRFILEFFRVSSYQGAFHLSHLWALAAFVIGISFYIEITVKKPKKKGAGK